MVLGFSSLGETPLGYFSIGAVENIHICPKYDIGITSESRYIFFKSPTIILGIAASNIGTYPIAAASIANVFGNVLHTHIHQSNIAFSFTNSDTVIQGETYYSSELGLSSIAAIPIAYAKLVKLASSITSFTSPKKEIEFSTTLVPPYVEEDVNTHVTPGYDITFSFEANESTIYRAPPSSVCSGYSFDGTSITIPLSCLPGLTAEEASVASGDWRDIFQSICLMSDLWVNTPRVVSTLQAYDSFYIHNPNSRRSLFQYGIGEHNVFLEKFAVTYQASRLKAEN